MPQGRALARGWLTGEQKIVESCPRNLLPSPPEPYPVYVHYIVLPKLCGMVCAFVVSVR